MKVIIKSPWYFKAMNILGCLLMLVGILEMYYKFLPADSWKYTPIACIIAGVLLIIPHHFVALWEILKYRPKSD